MNATAAGYQTKVTRVVPNGLTVQSVVLADPGRVMLRVYGLLGGSTVGLILPNVDALAAGLALTVPAPIEAKYKDAPDWCTSQWFGRGTDANGWLVVESTYTLG